MTEAKELATSKGVELELVWNEWSPEEWRQAVKYFIQKITINDDRTLTVEGVLSSVKEVPAAKRTR